MEHPGITAQVSIVILLIAVVGLGAGGLYTYTSRGITSGSSSQATDAGTTKYLGYVPKGYVVAPLLPNAPSFPCPSNFDSAQCAQFKASCGNGVCDPDETCSSCPIDCGVPQGLSCDPYTGRASGATGVCQLNIPYSVAQPPPSNPTLNMTQPATSGG
jgi:hypothetical protein